MSKEKNTDLIKRKALELGFEDIGIAEARRLDEEEQALNDWLKQGRHGSMSYMENHFELRLDPRLLVPDSKSVITLSYNYYTDDRQLESNAPKIAEYAYGRDYHKVVKKKLLQLFEYIKKTVGEVNGRCFVDSAPILERVWARNSGVGWTGKNSLSLTKGKGSYYFLGVIICDLDLVPDGPVKDYCGSCTKCIDACPTQAIYEPYKVDGSKCISYLTIELKEAIPDWAKGKMDNWAFGCDICQDVCPINARSKVNNEPDFRAKERMLRLTEDEWHEMSEVLFDELFTGTPLKRTKFKGLKRNLLFLRS